MKISLRRKRERISYRLIQTRRRDSVEININFKGLIEEWRVGVADIIELEKRRQQQQSEKTNGLNEEKFEVLKKVLQCARCQLKCSRCGTQIEETEDRQHSPLPYPLCSGCGDEYKVYLELTKGESATGRYWHNQEWMEIWRTWLQHQKALDHYRSSKEFIKLLHEFEGLW
jgi:Pyruvate/2-oxoacid:ferredoxin oxidoreductase delta subunit